jgi:hypothetical protein
VALGVAPVHYLSVQIVRFLDERQPELVACEFTDAEGRCHTIEDKVPLFSGETVSARMAFPRPGILRCEELQRWRDAKGRELVRISTGRPDGVASTEGISEFTVLARLVSSEE